MGHTKVRCKEPVADAGAGAGDGFDTAGGGGFGSGFDSGFGASAASGTDDFSAPPAVTAGGAGDDGGW